MSFCNRSIKTHKNLVKINDGLKNSKNETSDIYPYRTGDVIFQNQSSGMSELRTIVKKIGTWRACLNGYISRIHVDVTPVSSLATVQSEVGINHARVAGSLQRAAQSYSDSSGRYRPNKTEFTGEKAPYE